MNPINSRQDYHLTQPFPSEEKQTKTQHKSQPIQTLYKPLDQPQEGRNQKEERLQTLSLGKGDRKHKKLKNNNNNEKAEKYYTSEGTNQKHRSPNK